MGRVAGCRNAANHGDGESHAPAFLRIRRLSPRTGRRRRVRARRRRHARCVAYRGWKVALLSSPRARVAGPYGRHLAPDLAHEGSGGPAGGTRPARVVSQQRSEEHTSELQSQSNLVCRLLLEKKKKLTKK